MDIVFWPQNIQGCDLDFTDEEIQKIRTIDGCFLDYNNSLFAKTENWWPLSLKTIEGVQQKFYATFAQVEIVNTEKRGNLTINTFDGTGRTMELVGRIESDGNFWAILP